MPPFCYSLSVIPRAAHGRRTGPVRVNIGVASVSSSALSLWAAEEQKIFAKHGVEARLILIRGGSTLVASLLTNEIHAAFTSGVSVLGAAAQGIDVKMLTAISSRVSWKLIAAPQIQKADQLRGKRFGVQSIVGSTWMYAMLALEALGLEPKRDNISFIPIGDPVVIAQALEAGMIWVNSENVRHLPTPFGGVKSSGIGRDGGDYSFDFYMEAKNIAIALDNHKIPKIGS